MTHVFYRRAVGQCAKWEKKGGLAINPVRLEQLTPLSSLIHSSMKLRSFLPIHSPFFFVLNQSQDSIVHFLVTFLTHSFPFIFFSSSPASALILCPTPCLLWWYHTESSHLDSLCPPPQSAFCPTSLLVRFFRNIQCPQERVSFSLPLMAFCSLVSTLSHVLILPSYI